MAATATLLRALHPLRVESFAWITERKDVLCAAFFIASILGYVYYTGRPSRGRYLAWTCLGELALMSKAAAVSLAPVLLLLDYWPLRRAWGIVPLLKEVHLQLGSQAQHQNRPSQITFKEMYDYTNAGLTSGKHLQRWWQYSRSEPESERQ